MPHAVTIDQRLLTLRHLGYVLLVLEVLAWLFYLAVNVAVLQLDPHFWLDVLVSGLHLVATAVLLVVLGEIGHRLDTPKRDSVSPRLGLAWMGGFVLSASIDVVILLGAVLGVHSHERVVHTLIVAVAGTYVALGALLVLWGALVTHTLVGVDRQMQRMDERMADMLQSSASEIDDYSNDSNSRAAATAVTATLASKPVGFAFA